MDIRILGPFEVTNGGSPLPLGGTKQRAVLAMLALQVNRVASSDFLIEGLWGTRPPDSATNVVQSYVSRLRKVLPADGCSPDRVCVLRRRNPGYVLETDPAAVDVHRFEQLVTEGALAISVAPERAAARLREGLQLWAGSPLAEFTAEPFTQVQIPGWRNCDSRR